MRNGVVIDTIRPGGKNGGIAAMLLNSNFDVNSLRVNDVLQKDEWIAFDNTVLQVTKERLVAVADLLSRGLTFNLPNAMGHTQLQWEAMSDMTPAEISMSGVTPGQNDRVLYELNTMPIPIIHKDFNINVRALAASRNRGVPLDTAQVQLATRLVTETVEEMLFNGHSLQIGGAAGGTIYGYTTAPNRSTGSLTAGWDTATGEQIIGDVLTMIEAATNDNMFGPYMLYVPIAYDINLGNDFKAASDKTIRQRVLEIGQISGIRATHHLTDEVILAQLTSDVVDEVVGFEPTLVQWETHGGMVTNFKVMTIMVPRFKTDFEDHSGVVHYSKP